MVLSEEQFDDHAEIVKTIEHGQQSVQENYVPVEISRELYWHTRRIEASKKHVTVSEYLEQLLDKIIPKTDELELVIPGHPPTQESIDQLREFREKLFRKNNYQLFEDSVEEIRQMREERLRQLMGEE